MSEIATLREALIDEVKDLYNAEKQLTKALPKLAKKATSSELRDALSLHLEETENHIARLEQVFSLLDEKPRGKQCEGMQGIIDEGNSMLQDVEPGPVMDACIIAGAQRAEHYEMTAYGTCVAWAQALGLDEAAGLLDETLEEEKAADEKLTAIAEAGINDAATAGSEDEEDEEVSDDESEDDAGPARASSAGSRSAGGRSATSRSAAPRKNGRR